MNKPYTSSLRIISGYLRGRKITFHPTPTLRPTTDRIRETVFNWLQPYIANTICLDLFAGTGALGLEACSRGAQHVTFIEANKQTIISIQNLIKAWEITNATALQMDTLTYLQQSKPHPFNLIFLDPPFHSKLLQKCAHLLTTLNWLAPECLIYTESQSNLTWITPQNWHLVKTKTSGQVSYSLWKTPHASNLKI